MLIVRAEIRGVGVRDVRCVGGRIVEIGEDLSPRAGESTLDAAGGALLPGLHDHHIHLFALAAAGASVRCGPPTVNDRAELARALATDSGADAWLRGIGYHESVAGDLDRDALDRLIAERPVRIQHRSGMLWVVNSAGIEQLGLDREPGPEGVERDRDGRPTGRLFRLDAWLRERIGGAAPPKLDAVGRRLASYGVTGVTDATPVNGVAELRALADAIDRGELVQRVVVMGASELPASHDARIECGATKLMLDEFRLPALDRLEASIRRSHDADRAVAIHCVTRAELVLAVGAFSSAGCRAGDRIEHGSVAPPEVVEQLADLGLTVVTQPNFVRERGDAYLSAVEPRDRSWLYRGRGFVEAGVPLGGGTDAPFGDPDPWSAIRAAVDRRTESGAVLGAGEGLSPERALALFTSPAAAPGASPRRVEVGSDADLCLLDRAWKEIREELSSRRVAATLRAGELVWRAGS